LPNARLRGLTLKGERCRPILTLGAYRLVKAGEAALVRAQTAAPDDTVKCPLWVKSRHVQCKSQCPL